MDRAFSSGSSASPPTAPASPSIGYATAGNPGTGTAATKPGPYWYHMMTEEIRGVLVAAGLTPAQGDVTQLLQALRAAGVFQTQATNDSTTKAATTAFVNPGSSIAANGYLKLPSGLIVQWGITTTSASAPVAVTFPITFPAACYGSFVCSDSATAQFGSSDSTTTSGFSVNGWLSNTGARSAVQVRWLALGK